MKSRLYVSACRRQEKTILEDIYCEAPYQIMMPLYDGDWMETVIMSSSAGIFGGDCANTHINAKKGVKLRIKSQSYEKVFQRKEQKAVKKVQIQIDEGAECVYLPYPVIPFAKSRYECDTEVRLHKDSTFLYGDIFNCGRIGMAERFEMDWFQSRTKIYVEDRLAFADHTYINPKQWNYYKLGLWHGYSHNGILYIYFPKKMQEDMFLEWFRKWSETFAEKKLLAGSGIYIGSTRCISGVGIWVLGMEGDFIYQIFEGVAERIYKGL